MKSRMSGVLRVGKRGWSGPFWGSVVGLRTEEYKGESLGERERQFRPRKRKGKSPCPSNWCSPSHPSHLLLFWHAQFWLPSSRSLKFALLPMCCILGARILLATCINGYDVFIWVLFYSFWYSILKSPPLNFILIFLAIQYYYRVLGMHLFNIFMDTALKNLWNK